jgi:hypothetical protein
LSAEHVLPLLVLSLVLPVLELWSLWEQRPPSLRQEWGLQRGRRGFAAAVGLEVVK